MLKTILKFLAYILNCFTIFDLCLLLETVTYLQVSNGHFALSRANSNNETYINFQQKMYFILNILKVCSAPLNTSTDRARRYKGAKNSQILFNRFEKYRFSDFPHVLF